jgi:hypothetical protein
MEAKLWRDRFVAEMAEAQLRLTDLSESQLQAFAAAGITRTDLDYIAGDDGVIQGSAEFVNLFVLMDFFDKDGREDSLDLLGADGTPTQAGRIHELTRRHATVARHMSREQFLARFGDGALELRRIGDLQPLFDKLGLTRMCLEELADDLGRLRGKETLTKLWRLVLALDHGGQATSGTDKEKSKPKTASAALHSDSIALSLPQSVARRYEPAEATLAGLAVGLLQAIFTGRTEAADR